MILLFILAAASLAGYLAMPALAGLLILTAWLMSEPSRWAERMTLRAGDLTVSLFFRRRVHGAVRNSRRMRRKLPTAKTTMHRQTDALDFAC